NALQLVRARRIGDAELHAGVAKDMLELGLPVLRIDQHRHAARKMDPQIGDDEFRAVLEQQGDSLSTLKTRCRQGSREVGDRRCETAVGDDLILKEDRGPLWLKPRMVLDHLHNRRHAALTLHSPYPPSGPP